MADYTSGPLTTEGIEDHQLPASSEGEAPAAPPEPRLIRTLKIAGWVFFGLFCLLFFTILKLPDDRIKAYVQGTISSILAPKGITFSSQKGYLSMGWGLSYVMKDVTLNLPPPEPAAHVEKITVTPSLLPMIFGYQGAAIVLQQGDGKLSASFSMKGSQLSVSFKAKELDLGKTGILALGAGIKGSGLASGEGSFSGDLSIPSTLSGDAELDLKKVVLDAQQIQGFNVPRLSISDAKVELAAEKGKATIKHLHLGKPGSSDDLIATGSGDVILGRNWDSSTLNAKVNFKLSDPVMKAFILLDALLGAGKQGDGSYSLTLTGPVTSPNPVPLAPGAK